MQYFDELKKSMTWLGKKQNTVFIGQAVSYPGTAMTNTLVNISKNKLIELPVAEDMQMGMSLEFHLMVLYLFQFFLDGILYYVL